MAFCVFQQPNKLRSAHRKHKFPILTLTGTIFNQVIIWRAPALAHHTPGGPTALTAQTQAQAQLPGKDRHCALHAPSPQGDGEPGTVQQAGPQTPRMLVAEPAARLVGHEGAVFGVRWAAGPNSSTQGRDHPLPPGDCVGNSCSGSGGDVAESRGELRVISVSDDRSARVWDVSQLLSQPALQPTAGGCAEVTAAVTMWGHTARVWDGVLLGDLAVTGSEDCTAKLWDWKKGTCLATLQV